NELLLIVNSPRMYSHLTSDKIHAPETLKSPKVVDITYESSSLNLPFIQVADIDDVDSEVDLSHRSLKYFSHSSSNVQKSNKVEPLNSPSVRWFYHGENKWIPFCGYDSLNIEHKFREKLSSSSGCLPSNEMTKPNDDDNNNENKIIVKGGLYDVDISAMTCTAVYWKEVLRATWFQDDTYYPLEEVYSRQVETEHLIKFRGETINKEDDLSIRKTKEVIYQLRINDFLFKWFSNNEVYMSTERWTSRFMQGFRKKLFQSNIRIRRGYKEDADMEDKQPDINHIVLREMCNRMIRKYFMTYYDSKGKAEFLPVEWRSSLKLDGYVIDSITPNRLKNLRTMVNSSAMDILYYTSPQFRSE
ncbi:unnamed protein product, partial [Didymodactylos carnosus]